MGNKIFSVILLFVVLLISDLVIKFNRQRKHSYFTQTKRKRLKTILLWNSFFYQSDYFIEFGKKGVMKYCGLSDCYVTNNRSFLSVDKFDAILIHGPLFDSTVALPSNRSFSQYYVVLDHEAPQKFPTRKELAHGINLTIGYRMDSDIFVPYVRFYDASDRYVGPKPTPEWINPIFESEYLKQFSDIYNRKSKPLSWLVSNCDIVFNNRSEYVNELENYMAVDTFGLCGKLYCPPNGSLSCSNLIKSNYFFYLAFENQNCVDYLSEKLYTAMKNEAVPIVLNGADMKKMAPPYSYIDARKYEPKHLASYLKFLMTNPEKYLKYHWWRKTYYVKVIHETRDPICELCQYLGSKELKHTFYENFVDWRDGPEGNRSCTQNSSWRPLDDSNAYFYESFYSTGIEL